MIWVNAMRLISLVLGLTSALVATLLQQWGRRYIETPNVSSDRLSTNPESSGFARQPWYYLRDSLVVFGSRPA